MPHPSAIQHAAHDLELVAAHACGDASGADLDAATTLVAACAECAALHHDIRSIAAAVGALPAPVRTRDFRLSAGQAASLRPSGWRRLVAAFASPKLSFTAPLGAGMAALGMVGVLVASGVVPAGGPTAGGTAPDVRADASGAESSLASPASDAFGTVEIQAPGASQDGGTRGAADGSPVPLPSVLPAKAPGATDAPAQQPAPQPDEASPDPATGPAVNAAPVTPVPTDPERTQAAAPASAPQDADSRFLVAAGILLLAGLALIVLRWASRRVA